MFIGIAAMSKNRVLGKAGKLPWKISEDLALFKAKTVGHRVIMGRKTYDSLHNSALKQRENIILSKNHLFTKNVSTYSDFDLLLHELKQKKDSKENFVIGGARIFSLFLPYIQKIYLSVIQNNFEGDVFFPLFEDNFIKNSSEKISATIPFDFQTWIRKT